MIAPRNYETALADISAAATAEELDTVLCMTDEAFEAYRGLIDLMFPTHMLVHGRFRDRVVLIDPEEQEYRQRALGTILNAVILNGLRTGAKMQQEGGT